MATITMVLALWIVGLVAAQHLVAWLHAATVHLLLTIATQVLRRDRLA